jgi:hypothetical protein
VCERVGYNGLGTVTDVVDVKTCVLLPESNVKFLYIEVLTAVIRKKDKFLGRNAM